MDNNMIETNFSMLMRELQELKQRLDKIEGKTAMQKPVAPQFNQRTGNYSPEDISIEKIFYAGKR